MSRSNSKDISFDMQPANRPRNKVKTRGGARNNAYDFMEEYEEDLDIKEEVDGLYRKAESQ